jgi:transcriptional regulator with XRE-family HTH domain|tara:strand:+ start:196 stop:381 length:186 start_codon:yes stop_codon:yes gene_type:complete
MNTKDRERLLAAKKKRKLTYRELGALCNVSRAYIEMLLNGRIPAPKYKTLVIDKLRSLLLD